MKLRITLKPINDYSKSKTINTTSRSLSSQQTNTDIIINYPQSSNDSPILHLKLYISLHLQQQSDTIELWHKDTESNKMRELNDMDSLSKILQSTTSISTIDDDGSYTHTLTQTQTQMTGTTFRVNSNPVVYYKLTPLSIGVSIDFNQKNIEKITFKLSSSCSIIHLKHKIKERLIDNDTDELLMTEDNQRLFGISIKNISKHTIYKMVANKEYNDRIRLKEIIDSFRELNLQEEIEANDDIVINILLVVDTKKTMKMGLNFNFNYFKNLSNVAFDENAPSYRECSDGLNMFFYCLNEHCSIYNEMFVRKIGYGCFDILTESERARCPCCYCSSMLEARNIGMINAKWDYIGVLMNKKSRFEGDGMSLENNRLYLLSEVKIISAFQRLSMNIQPFKINELTEDSKDITSISKNKDELDDDIHLFDSIPLCLDEKQNENLKDHSSHCILNGNHMLCNEMNLTRQRQGNVDNDNKVTHCMKSCLSKGNSDSLCLIF